MSYAPALVVEAPARKPLSNGIFDAVTWLPSQDEHWLNGIEWEALSSRTVSGIGFDAHGIPTEGNGLPLEFPFDSGVIGTAEAFTVYATYKVSTIGHDLDWARKQATKLLLAREQARVEQAMWTGDLENQDTSFDHNAISLGTDMTPVAALAAIEEWQGNVYGSEGAIHMSRSLAINLANGWLISMDDQGVLRTVLGTRVVVGAGYSPAAGNDIIVTPDLFGFRGDIVDIGTRVVDKSNNDVLGLVQRSYVIGYDPVGCAKATVTL